MREMITITEKKGALKPFTPSLQEWEQILELASTLSVEAKIHNDKGYKGAPVLKNNSFEGYVQKYISGWKVKQEINIRVVLPKHKRKLTSLTIPIGTILQLNKNHKFIYEFDKQLIEFEISREVSFNLIYPIYDLVMIKENRILNLSVLKSVLFQLRNQKEKVNEMVRNIFFNFQMYGGTTHV